MDDEDRAAARLEARRESVEEHDYMRCEDCGRDVRVTLHPAVREGHLAGAAFYDPDSCPLCGGALLGEDV